MDLLVPHWRQGPGGHQTEPERGKLSPREGIPYQTANRLPVSNQRLTEILDGWHPLGGLQSEISSPEETQAHWTQVHLETGEATTREVIRRTAPEQSVLARYRVAWAAQTREWHKTQAQQSLCPCGVPENLNLSGLDLGSARNPGPTPYRATWSLSRVVWENTHHEPGQTQCDRDTASTPHTHQ